MKKFEDIEFYFAHSFLFFNYYKDNNNPYLSIEVQEPDGEFYYPVAKLYEDYTLEPCCKTEFGFIMDLKDSEVFFEYYVDNYTNYSDFTIFNNMDMYKFFDELDMEIFVKCLVHCIEFMSKCSIEDINLTLDRLNDVENNEDFDRTFSLEETLEEYRDINK